MKLPDIHDFSTTALYQQATQIPVSYTHLDVYKRQVENIRERANSYALVCRVLYRNGNRGRRTYILAKGYEDEE